jgi:hypothetical protein
MTNSITRCARTGEGAIAPHGSMGGTPHQSKGSCACCSCLHLSQWSFKETEERVKDSLGLRWFCRVSFEQVPDETTFLRWLHPFRPETLHALHDRVVQLARQGKRDQRAQAASGCAPLVQTTIHHPTESGLLVRRVCACSPLSCSVPKGSEKIKCPTSNRCVVPGYARLARLLKGCIDHEDAQVKTRMPNRRPCTTSCFRPASRWSSKVSRGLPR